MCVNAGRTKHLPMLIHLYSNEYKEYNIVRCTKLTNWPTPYMGRKLTANPCNRRNEGNILFNYALNTFYLWLYGVGHKVNDHSDSERGNPLLPHGLLFLINSKGSFICTIPQIGQHIQWPLLHQALSTGWNEK